MLEYKEKRIHFGCQPQLRTPNLRRMSNKEGVLRVYGAICNENLTNKGRFAVFQSPFLNHRCRQSDVYDGDREEGLGKPSSKAFHGQALQKPEEP